jgi:hypothetical protein
VRAEFSNYCRGAISAAAGRVGVEFACNTARMSELIIAETRAWVERAVIGLHLCPFARGPQSRGQVLYVLSTAIDARTLLADLARELRRLIETPPAVLETTLLIHPHVLTDFLDYNDFLDEAEAAVAALGLRGEIQIASFHPRYQFAGSELDALANATNRSPYPLLQLLREASVERALTGVARPEAIYEANIATLEHLGPDGWVALQRQCRKEAIAATGESSDPE